MKRAVVVHGRSAAVELDWSKQFALLDRDVNAQFASLNLTTIRVQQVFTIPDFTWDKIVATVTSAAQAAGAGGIVVVASGHGGAVPNDLDGGVINWDPTDTDVDLDWTPQKVRKGLFWDDVVARYVEPIPFGNPPTRKAEDERDIAKKVKDFQVLQKRHDAFDGLDRIGKALKAAGVARLTFTNCTAGRAQNFMKRLAKICQLEVACFNQKTMVLDDGTFGLNPGKARMILERDKARDGLGTNIMSARVFSPDLDDPAIAFVGRP